MSSATPVDTIAERVIQAAAACPAGFADHRCRQHEGSDRGGGGCGACQPPQRAAVCRQPSAGGRSSHGPEHARADLFDGRTVVITPTESTRPAAVTEVSGFWQSLGAECTTMTPAKHDAALAMTSHLPHLVAVALAAATPAELLPLAASGWRDTTRMAGGDPKFWQPIFAANRQHVLDALERLTNSLESIREALEQGDYETFNSILEAAAKEETGS